MLYWKNDTLREKYQKRSSFTKINNLKNINDVIY